MANADALSQLPLPESPSSVPIPGDINVVLDHLSQNVVSASQIKLWTGKDPVLVRVRHLVQTRWTISDPGPDIHPYFRRHTELSVIDGYILWGSRVVIPLEGRRNIIKQLHETHPGVSKMKSLARSYVWWPGLDSDIEKEVQQCKICQLHRSMPSKAPLHPWEFPSRPWVTVHIDHLGPFLGKLYLLLIDAHSKWMEVHVVPSTSTEATIEKLRIIFGTHGIPEQLVSDWFHWSGIFTLRGKKWNKTYIDFSIPPKLKWFS